MGLTMSEKRAITREVARRYRKARKKEKGGMLNEFVAITSYNRNYAAWILRNWHRDITIDPAVREKILEMSAATIDRLLKGEREKWQVKGKSTTKPKDASKEPDTDQDLLRLE